MRRIYDSAALDRDDRDPFRPGGRGRDYRPQAMRWVNSSWLSRQLLPQWLVRRAVTVAIRTNRPRYAVGEGVPFEVEFKNHLPAPITIRTGSPVGWTWTVDGHPGTRVGVDEGPDDGPWAFRLDRGERRCIRRVWNGAFRTGETEWRRPDPGAHTLAVTIDTVGGSRPGLRAETAFKLVESSAAESVSVSESDS